MVFFLTEETWGRGWCISYGQAQGGREELLGQSRRREDRPLAEAVLGLVPAHAVGKGGEFIWPTKTVAARAMRIARLTVRELEEGRPWPDWARRAIAEGWKPPRRWKPPRLRVV